MMRPAGDFVLGFGFAVLTIVNYIALFRVSHISPLIELPSIHIPAAVGAIADVATPFAIIGVAFLCLKLAFERYIDR